MYDSLTSGVGVYPRVYGGTLPRGEADGCTQGLSPRVRGNRARPFQSQHGRGSIPACTGEPGPLDGHTQPYGVYPRVYGGTTLTLDLSIDGTGLSPRVRGNLQGIPKEEVDHGSIPACTGEPISQPRHFGHERVYPRVYGGTHSR